MSPKHLGLVIVAGLALLLVQLGTTFQKRASDIKIEVKKARDDKVELETQLKAEQELLDDRRRESRELLEFVSQWKPYFAVMTEKQDAETGISMKVREAKMLNLSQRYEEIPHKINNKNNESLPVLLRASLLFDDNFSKLLNWFGQMEKIRPTMRVGKIDLSKGSRGNDLRMELVLEVPLRKGGG
jgi:hypothetical protein